MRQLVGYAQACCLFAACWPAIVVLSCMMNRNRRRSTRRLNTELLAAFPHLAHDKASYLRLQTKMRESVDRGQHWLLSALKRVALQGILLDEHKSESKQRFVEDMDRFWRELGLGQDGAVLKQWDSLMIQYRSSCDDGNETRERKHRLWCHLSIIRSNVSNETASRIQSVVMTKDNNESISEFVLCMDDDVPCSEFVLDAIVRIMYTGQVRSDYFSGSYFDVSMLQRPTLVDSIELSKEEERRLDAWICTLLEMLAVYQHLQMHNHMIESFIYLQLDELVRHGYSLNIITQIQRLGSTLLDELMSHISASSQELRSFVHSGTKPEWNLYAQRKIHGDMTLELDIDEETDSTKTSVNLHKSVLMARSEYFRNMFLSRMSESNMLRVKLPLCQSYSVLKSYVFYLYHGYMRSEDLGEIGVELIGIAKLMDDIHLMSLCEEAIARRIDATNVIELHKISKNMSLSELASRCEKMLVYLRETGEIKDIPAFDVNEITEQYLLSYRFQNAECFLENTCNSSLHLNCVFIIDEYPDFWKVIHSFLVRNCGIEELFDEEYLSKATHTIRFKDSGGKEVFISVKFDALLSSEVVEHRLSIFEPSHLFFVTSARCVTDTTLQQAIELCDMIPHRFADRDHFFTLVVGDRHISPVGATIPTRLINYCELGPIEDSTEIIDRMFFSAFRMGIYRLLSNRVYKAKAMKPILYLYKTGSCDRISISLKDNEKEDVDAVYPHYHCPVEKRWQVLTANDGTLIDATNNRKLQYIFWETVIHHQFSEDIRRESWEYSKGVFSVSKSDYIPFLEQCLEQLGMSERESNDFIVYWLTQLNQKENCLIKFETDQHIHHNQPTEFCSSVECLIEPTPNQYIRVMMLFKEGRSSLFDWSGDRVKKELPTIQRIDPTMTDCLLAVEWGGRESFI